ncbi:MAG TPA: hypothetical protein ENK80_04500 [Rhodobacterales bacterium]|nr:hypothetical protein [Rhodobacterales bacterium]
MARMLKSYIVVGLFTMLALALPRSAKAADFHVGYFDGTSSITLVGQIVPGDAERFRQTLRKISDGDGVATHLYLFSPGGSIGEALEIGRLASQLAMTTIAPSYDAAANGPLSCFFRVSQTETDYEDIRWRYNRATGEGDARCNCASACFLIWAGGARRAGNYLGIHRAFYRPELFKQDDFDQAREKYRNMRHIIENYLDEMNVPGLVVDRMFSVSSTDIQPLAQEFVEIMQAPAAFDEYTRAFCPQEVAERENAAEVLKIAKAQGVSDAGVQVLNTALQAAYDKAFYCERDVRRKIFRKAYAKIGAE